MIKLLLIIIVSINMEVSAKPHLIGGQRDKHNCLLPAGYSWDKDINACVRNWEIPNKKNFSKNLRRQIASLDKSSDFTVISINKSGEEGCYEVKLHDDTKNEIYILQVSSD